MTTQPIISMVMKLQEKDNKEIPVQRRFLMILHIYHMFEFSAVLILLR